MAPPTALDVVHCCMEPVLRLQSYKAIEIAADFDAILMNIIIVAYTRDVFFLAGPPATQNGQVGEHAKIKEST